MKQITWWALYALKFEFNGYNNISEKTIKNINAGVLYTYVYNSIENFSTKLIYFPKILHIPTLESENLFKQIREKHGIVGIFFVVVEKPFLLFEPYISYTKTYKYLF